MAAVDSSPNLVQLNELSAVHELDEVNVDRPRQPSKLQAAGMASIFTHAVATESSAPAIVPTSKAGKMWSTSVCTPTPESHGGRRGSVERPHGRGWPGSRTSRT